MQEKDLIYFLSRLILSSLTNYRTTVLLLLLNDNLGIITSNQGFAARMINKSDAIHIKSAGVTSTPRVVTGLLP